MSLKVRLEGNIPLLFVVRNTFAQSIVARLQCGLVYADAIYHRSCCTLMIIEDSITSLEVQKYTLKECRDAKERKVNIKKTKLMASGKACIAVKTIKK